jgi:hypothetical protein
MTLYVEISTQINVKDEELRKTDNFTYKNLGSIITSEVGTKEDIHSRLGKTRRVFREISLSGTAPTPS